MKTFIVSMALIITGICGLVHQTDMMQFNIISQNLKALCEECAAEAASCIDLDEVSKGCIHFNQNEANRLVNNLIEYANTNMDCFNNGKISLNSLDAEDTSGRCTVKLIYKANSDMFRLGYVFKDQIEHESCYEWM